MIQNHDEAGLSYCEVRSIPQDDSKREFAENTLSGFLHEYRTLESTCKLYRFSTIAAMVLLIISMLTTAWAVMI